MNFPGKHKIIPPERHLRARCDDVINRRESLEEVSRPHLPVPFLLLGLIAFVISQFDGIDPSVEMVLKYGGLGTVAFRVAVAAAPHVKKTLLAYEAKNAMKQIEYHNRSASARDITPRD